MADADVTIKDGAGADRKVDSRTVGAGTDEHRQVVVIGSPTSSSGVAEVDVSGLHVVINDQTNPVAVMGDAAHDFADAGNPVKIGGYASSALPAGVADGDRVNAWFTPRGAVMAGFPAAQSMGDALTNNAIFPIGADGNGGPLVVRFSLFNGTTWDRIRTIGGLPASDADTGIQAVADVPHKTGYAQVWKSANYTTAQTGTAVWTPAAGKKVVITSLVLSSYGTTAGRVLMWLGASGDTTYTAGTDQLVLPFNTAPSATAKPGIVFTPPVPVMAATADHVLRITSDAAVSIDVSVYGYEV